MITINSDRLSVQMLEPGSEIYARTRFDWTGFITQVVLDGLHTFCVDESPYPDEGTGGMGLCNEFGSQEPVGYDDAKPGEQFPKIGIGLLTRVDESAYTPFFAYPCEPFPMHVETTDNGAVFFVEALPTRGYAIRLEKTVLVEENVLTVHYYLENVGEKMIETKEYNHNFVGIDHTNFGEGYELEFAFPPVFDPAEGPFTVDGSILRWPSRLAKSYCHAMTGFEGKPTPWWELRMPRNGLSIREQTDFDWTRGVLFGTRHLVSPEVFVDIRVEPGETQEWRRDWTFNGPAPEPKRVPLPAFGEDEDDVGPE